MICYSSVYHCCPKKVDHCLRLKVCTIVLLEPTRSELTRWSIDVGSLLTFTLVVYLIDRLGSGLTTGSLSTRSFYQQQILVKTSLKNTCFRCYPLRHPPTNQVLFMSRISVIEDTVTTSEGRRDDGTGISELVPTSDRFLPGQCKGQCSPVTRSTYRVPEVNDSRGSNRTKIRRVPDQ